MANKKTNNNGRNFNSTSRRGSSKRGSQRASTTTQDKSAQSIHGNDPKFCDAGVSKGNDISWYSYEPNLVVNTASIPYGRSLGLEVNLESADTQSLGYNPSLYIPGIMVMRLVPGPGFSNNNASVVNVAARSIYTYVRHVNSGHANYDSQDLMMYLLAMDEAYMLYVHFSRVYGICNMYNNQNRYFPKAMVTALGFDFEDLIHNMADFRAYLNQFAVRLGNLCCPEGMPYFLRHRWLYSGLYTDGVSAKAQMYAYSPQGYRVYDELGEKGGALRWKVFPSAAMKVSDVWNICREVVDKLLGSEDIGIMSGDILHAYGQSQLIQLPELPSNYVVVPVYNEEVLSQFQNATIIGAPNNFATGSLDITQDPSINNGTVIYQPSVKLGGTSVANAVNICANRLVNLHMVQPTPADTMVATRLMCIGHLNEDKSLAVLEAMGTEFVISCQMYNYIDPDMTLSARDIGVSTALVATSGSGANSMFDWDDVANILSYVEDWTRFRYAPNYMITQTGEGGARISYTMAEVDTYATVDFETLQSMHDTAILSEFHVPQMGR